ncbi:MAG: HAD family hydrolase [Lentisphaeria bacterium]|nr:HAD family hydrolase [Lentisphaeria bacterium]
MDVRGIIFDLNGTLIDILTDEGNDDVYRTLSNFLSYQGMLLPAEELKQEFFGRCREQRRNSSEAYPEIDVVAVFRAILRAHGRRALPALPEEKRACLPQVLAELFRAASRFRLELYPGVQSVLERLHGKYPMAAVSDGQSVWALPELRAVKLERFFSPIVISESHGFRKPDPRLYQVALDAMQLPPENVIFVGNDMYRDVYGAQKMGMQAVFFRSNQGEQSRDGVEPDYIIYDFAELPAAIDFLRKKPILRNGGATD